MNESETLRKAMKTIQNMKSDELADARKIRGMPAADIKVYICSTS